MILFVILKMVNCMYLLESYRCGDSNENTKHTFMLKNIEKLSLLGLLIWYAAVINPHKQELPLFRTYIHGCKGTRGIEDM